MGFPGSAMVKNLPAKAGDKGDAGLIPGAWAGGLGWGMATVHGIAKSWTQLSMRESKNILISDLCQCVI